MLNKKVSELEDTEVKVGSRVQSIITSNFGTIYSTQPNNMLCRCLEHDEYHSIVIQVLWDHQGISYGPKCDYTNVVLI